MATRKKPSRSRSRVCSSGMTNVTCGSSQYARPRTTANPLTWDGSSELAEPYLIAASALPLCIANMLLLNHCAQVCSLFISSPSHVAEAFHSLVRTEILQFDGDLALIAVGRFESVWSIPVL